MKNDRMFSQMIQLIGFCLTLFIATTYLKAEIPQDFRFYSYGVQKLRINQPNYPAPGQRNYGNPVVIKDTMYFGTYEGEVISYNLTHKTLNWNLQHGPGIEGTISVKDDQLFVGDIKGRLTAYSLKVLDQLPRIGTMTPDMKLAGKSAILWTYQVPGELNAEPLVINNAIYFTTADHQLYALGVDSGELLWRYKHNISIEMTVKGYSSPVFYKGNIYTGFADGTLLVFDANSGSLNWKYQLGNSLTPHYDVDSTPNIVNDNLYTASYDKKLLALSLYNKVPLWTYEKAGSVAPVEVSKDQPFAYVSTTDGRIMALDKKSGSVTWETKLENSIGSYITVGKFYLAVGTFGGGIYILHKVSGKILWQHYLAVGATSRPIIYKKDIFFFSNFSNLYIVRLEESPPAISRFAAQ